MTQPVPTRPSAGPGSRGRFRWPFGLVLPLAAALVMGVGPARQRQPAPRPDRSTGWGAIVAAAPNPAITGLVGAVSVERLIANVADLESFQSRATTTAGAVAAANFLHDRFRSLDLDAGYDDFSYDLTWSGVAHRGLRGSNVVATLPGTVDPSQVVVVGAHFDSIVSPWPGAPRAPGADDNASGTALLIELARILAGRRFDFTVRIVAFDAEEVGLKGSAHHAQAARQAGERIVAMINLDMVGYANSPGEDLDLVVDEASSWLAAKFESASATFAPLPLVRRVDPTLRSSDHASFWQNGFAAIHAIEDIPLANPYYHKVTDTATTLDPSFLAAVTRATLAVVADLAQPSRALPPPSGLEIESTLLRALFFEARLVRLGWSAPAGPVTGYHVYRSATSHTGYERLTASPIRGTTFVDRVIDSGAPLYYVVTSVDGAGQESNYSVEVFDDGPTIR